MLADRLRDFWTQISRNVHLPAMGPGDAAAVLQADGEPSELGGSGPST
jgi:hypothetical protein